MLDLKLKSSVGLSFRYWLSCYSPAHPHFFYPIYRQ
jgi:hypothetical protein